MTLLDQQPWPSEKPPEPHYQNEAQRLQVLGSFALDTLDGDAELARIARFAAKLCGAPSAAVSVVDAERQRFIAREGIEVSETPRSTSFCAHAMLGSDILEVLDATADERFSDFVLVTGDMHLRYYAGAPLISAEGAPIGALCVTDSVPHETGLDVFQVEGLKVLAEAVKRRIETHRSANRATAEIEASADRLQFMLDSVPDIAWSASAGPEFDYFNARFTEVTGVPARKNVEDWREVIHPEDFEASLVKFSHAMETATLFEDEWRLRLADGSYRWVISRAVPSSDDPATARWFGTLTDIDEQYRISEERELLAGELAHRIKNVFSVITGLITMNARSDANRTEFAAELADTIRALSKAQDFALRINTASGENLSDLLEVLMAPYGISGSSRVTITGDRASFGKRSATPLALVFHELATNSAKYGALSAADGTIAIDICVNNDAVRIGWSESGGPRVEMPDGEGFGSRLMHMTITNQLGGKIERDWRAEGLQASITLPIDRLAQ